jgi:hypothetical protein
MAITDVTNLITGAFNNSLATSIPQSQSVTVQIRQGATGYAVTLPTTLGGGPVAYADGFNTVSSTAFATTTVTFTQAPSTVSGGTPFYVEVKSSDAGGGAAGDDGLIQFNIGGASLTGGRLGAAGNLFWSNSSQTLQTQNCNVVADLNALGNINGGTLNTGGTISAFGNVTGGNINTPGIVSAAGSIITPGTSAANIVSATAYVGTPLVITDSIAPLFSGNLLITANVNTMTGTLSVTGNIVGTSNISGSNLIGNVVGSVVSVTGNITAGNITTTGISNLGSLKTYNEAQYTLATSGTVNIDKLNGQVQYLAPTANVTIGSLNNFVTSQGGVNQSDTVTLIIKQSATPYTVTLPAISATIKYVSGISTVGTTANSVTVVSFSAVNAGGSALYLNSVSPEFV